MTTTVVIPCYNEANRLQVGRLLAFARSRRDIKLLFVNDGSTDETLSLLNQMADWIPGQISVCDLPINCGKAEAVRRGVLAAIEKSPNYVGYLDADLATPLDELPRFVDVLDRRPEIEVVIGTRIGLLGRQIDRNRSRGWLGRLFALVASRTIGLPIYDTQCGAKLFRVSDDTAALFAEPFCSRWIFDVELFARLIVRFRNARSLVRGMVYELPLEQWQDVAGSKVRSKDFVRAAFELSVIYWRYFVRGASAPRSETSTVVKPTTGTISKSPRPSSIEQSRAQDRRAA